jgi:hypothetical protein
VKRDVVVEQRRDPLDPIGLHAARYKLKSQRDAVKELLPALRALGMVLRLAVLFGHVLLLPSAYVRAPSPVP